MLHLDHPLFRELRNGFLWHCTSLEEFNQIHVDGFIKFNRGHAKWGPYACQELGGVSLFDFTTQPEHLVFESLHKWKQFLGRSKPVTIVMGFEQTRLPGVLTPYPASSKDTKGNVIPWVEVCHKGDIPVSAIAFYLLVCATDYSRFYKHKILTEQILASVHSEFTHAAQKDSEGTDIIRSVQESPEFRVLLNQAKLAAEKVRKQGL